MKYTVHIHDFAPGAHPLARDRRISGLSLAQAWRVSARASRRGVKLYGGSIHHDNWGARGGAFPGAYRATTIRLDTI